MRGAIVSNVGAGLPTQKETNAVGEPAGTDGWTKVLEDLGQTLTRDGVARWFAASALLDDDGQEITVGVPNLFIQNWIEQRYRALLEAACGRCLGPRRVRLKVDGKLYRQFRQAETDFLSQSSTRAASPSLSGPSGNSAAVSRHEAPVAEKLQRLGPDVSSTLNPAFTWERFVRGPGNLLAHSAGLHLIERREPVYSPLFVCGDGGTGKTHLLQALSSELLRTGRRSIRYLPAEGFTNSFVRSVRDRATEQFRRLFYGLEVLVIDDLHALAGKQKTQAELLHVIDAIANAGGLVVLAAEMRPQELPGFQGSLISRLRSGLVCKIDPPDRMTRLSILVGELRRRGRALAPAVLEFLADRPGSSVRGLLGELMRTLLLDSLSPGPLSVAEVRAGLEESSGSERRVHLARIAEVVALDRGLSPAQVLSRSRARSIALARQLGMHLARELTSHSLAEIGAHFGGRHPATVNSALRSFGERLAGDLQLQREVSALTARLTAR
ncbi:MAG: chromosomal replication initiator protein DnaA [Planctomycetota bacterium]